jgi:hypothetical protein
MRRHEQFLRKDRHLAGRPSPVSCGQDIWNDEADFNTSYDYLDYTARLEHAIPGLITTETKPPLSSVPLPVPV